MVKPFPRPAGIAVVSGVGNTLSGLATTFQLYNSSKLCQLKLTYIFIFVCFLQTLPFFPSASRIAPVFNSEPDRKSMARKIIIDTDPGQDDAVAILLALASPQEIDVLGIVAVAGNVGLAQNAKNALKVVELSGRTDVSVYAGCARPM